jgi:hypothetical protein
VAAFIYAELGQNSHYSYHKPILGQVKKQFPDLDFLDLDTFSEEFLITQGCQMVELASKCGVYFKSLEPDAALGATLRLAEVLIRRQQPTLVILQGTHTRLERLFGNRLNLNFLKNPEELMLQEHLNLFYVNT